MELQDIHSSTDQMYAELYFTKVKVWAESMGMPGEPTARRILDIRTHDNNDTTCRGKLCTGKKCTRKAKHNGYCGYHKGQFREAPTRRINWNTQNTENNVPAGLIIP